jgi:tRNA 2-thiouridine synthesizing protein A
LKEFVGEEEILVDARGHRCPVPTLKLRRACEAAPQGAVIHLLADDPLARIDAPHFANEAGLELLQIETVGPVISVRVRKPAPGS